MKNYVLLFIIFVSCKSFAVEPPYCNPATFSQYEISYPGKRPVNLHVYKIGQITLAGMAIGASNSADVVGLAEYYSDVRGAEKYCTFYYNNGNRRAEELFTWKDLPRPSGANYDSMVATYARLMGDHFDISANNFVQCGLEHGYVAVGCNGQKHRGPSIFAMIMGYAGCSPVHAAQIANQIWGTNGIKTEMRQALAEKASQIAQEHPDQSRLFRQALLQN